MKASATSLVAKLLVIKLPWQLKCNLDNFFVLYRIEFIFGMDISWHNRHQPHTPLPW